MFKDKKITLIISILTLVISTIIIIILFFNLQIEIGIPDFFSGIIGAVVGGFISFFMKKYARRKDKHNVFLSYTYNDKQIADELFRDLKALNIMVKTEDQISEAGDEVGDVISNAIKNSETFIVLISKDFYKSKDLKRYIESAKSLKKRIIPLVVDDSEIPNIISKIKYIDISKDYSRAFKDLANTLTH